MSYEIASFMQGQDRGGTDIPKFENNQNTVSSPQNSDERVYKLWIVNKYGEKLDNNSAKSLVYTLGIGLGLRSQRFPTSPPNKDIQYL